jgi:hypothetical protein
LRKSHISKNGTQIYGLYLMSAEGDFVVSSYT